jgi:hypothetical protein
MSAARYEHTARSLLDVNAFFFMHGAVHPKTVDGCYNYSLTGTKLPPSTQLYAPKILGKSYHASNIIDFVSRLKENWNEHQQHPVSFSEFCFSKIVDYERKQVDQMEQEIKDSDFIRFMESGNISDPRERKERRLFLEGAIVQKSQIRWDEHECFISEKSYYIIHGDKIKNCIMIFCDIKPINSLQRHEIRLSNGKEITVYVSYNRQTKLFKITFDRFTDYVFSFEELNQIVQFVVRSLNSDRYFNLAFFDFTCCVTLFNDDECLRDLTPELLSSVTLSTSDVPLPKLIYGTVSEDRRRESESALQRGITANYDSDYYSQKESLSPPPSPAHPSYQSPSPAQSNSLLEVNLLNGVESFADFEPISRFSSRSRSVSPNTRTTPPGPEEVGGGSRRRRRHRHVGNKVSRKLMTRRYHRRNRHTKVNLKRSKRQRGNTKSKC